MSYTIRCSDYGSGIAVFFLKIRRPPISTRTDTLFPYTTLFRSLHYESGGRAGEPPALPAARRLLALYQDWTRARGTEARAAVWRQMLDLHAEQVFTIGLVGAVRQPVVANPRLRNLPAEAPYLYDPGAHFGRYRMAPQIGRPSCRDRVGQQL